LRRQATLRRFQIVPIAGDAVAVPAAKISGCLRKLGIAISKTINLLIGT